MASCTELLFVTPEIKENVRKVFGLDEEGRLEDAIRILDDWIIKQNHFTKTDFDKEYLERAILFCKGSVEKAKTQIDRLCTFKTTVPIYFACTNLMDIKILFERCHIAVLPKLTPDHYRVVIVKVRKTDFDIKEFMMMYQFIVILAEYLKLHDYCAGYIFINDYRDISITDIATKLDYANLPQFLSVIVQGYGNIIKGVYFLTPSKLIDGIVKIIKQLVSEKLGKRIQSFNNLGVIHEFVPKEILPSDFGGDDKSMEDLNDQLVRALSTPDFENYLKDMMNARTDESRRPKDSFNEQYMGLPGSFRTLIVD